MIEDEDGHVSPEVFKNLFFTYFKGERYAYQVYEMLAPIVSEHYVDGQLVPADDPRAYESNKVDLIQKLT